MHRFMDSLQKLFCCFAPERPRPLRNADSTWKIFTLNELIKATNNFSYSNKLGEGGFGTVYLGLLPDESQIAVKRLKVWSARAEVEFTMEVEILGKLRHKNLLCLRGYCAEGQERIIVYDYMPNSSLHSHLHGRHSKQSTLDWHKRVKIALGSAEGIEYLHHHARPHIIHRDIKSSNILLDSEFEAQVADFGFAKLIPDGVTHVTTRVKGTLGYLAPEYAMWGKASESCDMYSFGVLLLEIVSGRRPLENLGHGTRCALADWASTLVAKDKYDDIADPALKGNYDKRQLKVLVDISIECAQSSARKRPTIHQVLGQLKDAFEQDLYTFQTSVNQGSAELISKRENKNSAGPLLSPTTSSDETFVSSSNFTAFSQEESKTSIKLQI